MRVRSLAQHAFRRMFSDIDVIVAPALYSPAPKVSERLDQEDTPQPEPKDKGFSALVPAGNLAGLPALCLPCGFANNLPVAMQLVGRPFSENTLIGIGKEFQSRTDWHRRKPPIS
jgi:aspartyl-tRNA(Asn)/glutamyl-tRNA(Gln) amidotransferase subunit A